MNDSFPWCATLGCDELHSAACVDAQDEVAREAPGDHLADDAFDRDRDEALS